MTEKFTASNGWYIKGAKIYDRVGNRDGYADAPRAESLIEYGRHLERPKHDRIRLDRIRKGRDDPVRAVGCHPEPDGSRTLEED